MKLSILIPTLPERKELFANLLNVIHSHIAYCEAWQEVEVMFDSTPKGKLTTGEKRNELLLRSGGKYVWFVDDDDMILKGAIESILKAADTDCDVMAINGIMTTNGRQEKRFYHKLGNPYCASNENGTEIYLRYPNHINPMKREIALQILFPKQNNFEDKAFADTLRDSGLLKTETIIEAPIYHYRYSTVSKTY